MAILKRSMYASQQKSSLVNTYILALQISLYRFYVHFLCCFITQTIPIDFY